MSNFKRISDRLTSAFVSSGMDEDTAKEAAFHMADWSDDVEGLSNIWHNLEQVDDERLLNFIYKFLAHAPNHIAAAKKLVELGPIEDVFNVGVLVEDDEDNEDNPDSV